MRMSENRTTEIRRSQGPGVLVSIDRKSLAPQENAQKQCAFGGAFLFSKFPGACIIIFMCGYNSFLWNNLPPR